MSGAKPPTWRTSAASRSLANARVRNGAGSYLAGSNETGRRLLLASLPCLKISISFCAARRWSAKALASKLPHSVEILRACSKTLWTFSGMPSLGEGSANERIGRTSSNSTQVGGMPERNCQQEFLALLNSFGAESLSLVTALASSSSLEEPGDVESVGDNASSSDQNNIGDRSDRQSEKSRAKTHGKKST